MHGLVVGLLGALLGGMSVSVCESFDACAVLERLERERPTVIPAKAGIQAVDVAPRLRMRACGSAPLPRALEDRIRRVFGQPLVQRYGTSETGMVLAAEPQSPPTTGRVGRPLPGWQLRVVDPATGKEADEGELWVKGEALFSGYFRAPELTRSAMEEVFFRTKDLVRRHADGSFDILGRQSLDLFKVRGHKVSAVEIEAVFGECPQVAECAVVGTPDGDGGEIPVAFVRARESWPGIEDRILEFVRGRLAPFQVPARVVVVEDLPRTGPSEVDKKQLMELARGFKRPG